MLGGGGSGVNGLILWKGGGCVCGCGGGGGGGGVTMPAIVDKRYSH